MGQTIKWKDSDGKVYDLPWSCSAPLEGESREDLVKRRRLAAAEGVTADRIARLEAAVVALASGKTPAEAGADVKAASDRVASLGTALKDE